MTISDNKNKAFGASRKESSLKANRQMWKRHKNHFGNVWGLLAIWLGAPWVLVSPPPGVRLVQESICRKKKKKHLFKKESQEAVRFLGLRDEHSRIRWADYLRREQRGFLPRGGGDAFTRALLSGAPSPRIHLQIALCSPKPALARLQPSLRASGRRSSRRRTSLSSPRRKGCPHPFPFSLP